MINSLVKFLIHNDKQLKDWKEHFTTFSHIFDDGSFVIATLEVGALNCSVSSREFRSSDISAILLGDNFWACLANRPMFGFWWHFQ